MAEFLADAAMRPSSTGALGLSPVPGSAWKPRRDARSLLGARRSRSAGCGGFAAEPRSAGAEGFPHRCAGAGSSPTPGADTSGARCSEVFIPDKRGQKRGPLRQLNFCRVSLFLLKGVITAIQLQ